MKTRLFLGVLFCNFALFIAPSSWADSVGVFEPYNWGDERELHFAHCLRPGEALRFTPDIVDMYNQREFRYVEDFEFRLRGPGYEDFWQPRWSGDSENFSRIGFRVIEARYPTLRNLPWVHLVIEPEDGFASRAVVFLLHAFLNPECQ